MGQINSFSTTVGSPLASTCTLIALELQTIGEEGSIGFFSTKLKVTGTCVSSVASLLVFLIVNDTGIRWLRANVLEVSKSIVKLDISTSKSTGAGSSTDGELSPHALNAASITNILIARSGLLIIIVTFLKLN